MERLEQILKWSWLAVPFMFAGWTLIAIQAVGLALIGGLLFYNGMMNDHWSIKYPVSFWTITLSFIPLLGINGYILFSWEHFNSEPLFYSFLSEFTILHWTGIL